jgi:hypothetical protein
MLCGIIAFQVLQQEPSNCRQVKAVLEKHAWYANQLQARLQDVPVADSTLKSPAPTELPYDPHQVEVGAGLRVNTRAAVEFDRVVPVNR